MSDLNGYLAADAARLARVRTHQIQRWTKRGHIRSLSRESDAQHHRYSLAEIKVAFYMGRLLSAGIRNLEVVESLARKHIEEVDILVVMGHTGDSIATEHTFGEGLMLTIT